MNSGRNGLPSDTEYEPFRFGTLEGTFKQEKFVAAKPIEADRLTFVGSPQFDLSELFDQKTFDVYSDSLAHAVIDEEFDPPLTRRSEAC